MQYKEIKKDLFSIDENHFLVHCISVDAKMGKGIAVDFVKRFPEIKILRQMDLKVGNCIRIGKVLNLITKEKYWEKPTYRTLQNSLNKCYNICLENKIYNLAMPKIGCGLDELRWEEVSNIIKSIFDFNPLINFNILICYK